MAVILAMSPQGFRKVSRSGMANVIYGAGRRGVGGGGGGVVHRGRIIGRVGASPPGRSTVFPSCAVYTVHARTTGKRKAS